jgi:signal transduction histidine kinase
VVLNLLLNAVQAMAERRDGKITVEITRVEQLAILRVRDTGPGIATEIASRVFDAYFTTRPDASGLGLSIVRDLVEQAGGTVMALEPGAQRRGASFEVRLPIVDPERPVGG